MTRLTLRSFPTRRSSDLDAPIGNDVRAAIVMPIRNENVARVFAGLQATYESVACRPDRKSTRLNSSHITISYAVSCWKKKNVNVVRMMQNHTPLTSLNQA